MSWLERVIRRSLTAGLMTGSSGMLALSQNVQLNTKLQSFRMFRMKI